MADPRTAITLTPPQRESFIVFDDLGVSESGKTRRWVVRTRDHMDDLGMVKWFGRWRCYAFFPLDETVFERHCLRDIADFCESQTQKQHEGNRG